MDTVERGDTVKVHYTGRLENGMVFDCTTSNSPLIFIIGEGELIPGFEEAVMGMKEGESKKVKVPADKAYGPYHKDLAMVVDHDQLPEDFEPEVGEQLEMPHEMGYPIVYTVTQVSESTVTLDANHILAGKDLIFEIQLVEIL
jgi:peptidylprolyl isomerase